MSGKKGLLRAVTCAVVSFVAWSVWLYAAAPVDALKGRVTYLPPYSHTPREAGLGVPGNLSPSELPESMIFATLYGEDISFATDHGVRPKKIARNLLGYFENGGRLSGGSTLTQQVVKNVFTGTHRTLYRKYVEMIYALRMEHDFTKEEIFTLYVNLAEVAPGVYGFREGASLYFGKSPTDLSDAEAAFVVNNLPSPKKRSAWLRDGTPDETAFGRTFALLTNARLLEARYDAEHLSPDTKSTLFSAYLREREPHALTHEEAELVLERSRHDAREFVLSHWRGRPEDVGAPAARSRAKK